MIELLKKTWNKYKTLKLWKKILWGIPLVLLAILCFGLFFISSKPKRTTEEQIRNHKKRIDKEISIKIEKEKELKKKEEQIKVKQEKLETQIKVNEQQTIRIINKIDSAVKNNDLEELEKFRKEINN